jgi:hypothetical protein
MKHIILPIVLLVCLQAAVFAQSDQRLWYKQPANSIVADVKKGWENDPEWNFRFQTKPGWQLISSGSKFSYNNFRINTNQ